MKFARNDLKVEGAAPVAHVVAYLEQLAQALKAGTAHVRQGDQQIVLGPGDIVGFSLAASDRGKRQSLSLEDGASVITGAPGTDADARGEAHEGEKL